MGLSAAPHQRLCSGHVLTQQRLFDDGDFGVGIKEGGDGVQAVFFLVAGKVVEVVEELGDCAGAASVAATV